MQQQQSMQQQQKGDKGDGNNGVISLESSDGQNQQKSHSPDNSGNKGGILSFSSDELQSQQIEDGTILYNDTDQQQLNSLLRKSVLRSPKNNQGYQNPYTDQANVDSLKEEEEAFEKTLNHSDLSPEKLAEMMQKYSSNNDNYQDLDADNSQNPEDLGNKTEQKKTETPIWIRYQEQDITVMPQRKDEPFPIHEVQKKGILHTIRNLLTGICSVIKAKTHSAITSIKAACQSIKKKIAKIALDRKNKKICIQ